MKIKFDTYGNERQLQCCEAWLDPEVTDIVYGGSKGSAKSFTGCSLIFGDAFLYPGTHYFIARKKLTDLRKFTIPSIFEVLGFWKITSNYYKFNGQDSFFELYNGSRVYLIEAKYLPGDPLYQRFGSMQMTRGWIEEAGEFEEAAKNNLQASIGRWKNDVYNLPGKLLQTCNPSKNYLYRDYYKKHKEGTLEGWKRFIQALPTDNKKLPDGYLVNLERSLSKNEKERLLHGSWEYDSDPAALIDYEKILDIFSNTGVQPGRKCITADIARLGGDRIVVIEWDGFRGKVKSWKKEDLKVTSQRIESLREKMRIGKSDVICDEDGVGGGVVDFMRYKGFVNNSRPVPSIEKHKDEKGNLITENFDNFKSQCGFHMAERINKNEVYLECDEETRELIIEELEQVKQKNLDSDLKKGLVPKDKMKEALGRSPDFWDAILMRQAFEFRPPRRPVRARVFANNY